MKLDVMLTKLMKSEYFVDFEVSGQVNIDFTSPFKFLVEQTGGLLSIFTTEIEPTERFLYITSKMKNYEKSKK